MLIGLPAGVLAEEAPKVEGDEIGLDVEETRFSAPLPYGKPFAVAAIEPAGSKVTLYMARVDDSEDCTDETFEDPALEVRVLVGAPAGGPLADQQKYTFKLPKLFPEAEYCFAAASIRQRPLEDHEQQALAKAMSLAANQLAAREASAEPLHAEECKALASTVSDDSDASEGGIRIWPCDLALETKRFLPEGLQQAVVYDSRRSTPVHIEEVIYRELVDHGQEFLDFVRSKILDVAANAALAETTQLPTAIQNARGIIDSKPLGSLARPIYDPMPAVLAEPLCTSLNSTAEPGKTAHADACNKPRSEFLQGVYAHKDSLATIKASGRTKALPELAERQLQVFLAMAKSPPYVEEPIGVLVPALSKLASDAPIAERIALAQAMQEKLDSFRSDSVPQLPNPPDAVVTVVELGHLHGQFRVIEQALTKIQKRDELGAALPAEATFETFLQRLQQQRVFAGKVRSHRASEGNTEDLFPFHASLDVGVAGLVFGSGHAELAQYFGVNMYFRAVDFSEPIWSNWNFYRVASLTFGITTTGSNNDREDVEGVIGSQYLMLGGGIRVLPFLRLTTGTFFLLQEEPNSAKSSKEIRLGYYAGASLDLDAFQLILDGFKSMGDT